jgi:hypothetical protein
MAVPKQREHDGVGDVTEIRRILAASKEVVVNKRGRRRFTTPAIIIGDVADSRRGLYTASPSHSIITEVTRTIEEHSTSQCVVQVCTWRRKFEHRKGRCSVTETIARVDIQPTLDGDTDSKACISVYLMQRETFQYGVCQNYITLPTRIIARTMIPDNSPIFDWILDGVISEVIDALEKGEVSLWSCDTMGRSLISVKQCYRCSHDHSLTDISTQPLPANLSSANISSSTVQMLIASSQALFTPTVNESLSYSRSAIRTSLSKLRVPAAKSSAIAHCNAEKSCFKTTRIQQ